MQASSKTVGEGGKRARFSDAERAFLARRNAPLLDGVEAVFGPTDRIHVLQMTLSRGVSLNEAASAYLHENYRTSGYTVATLKEIGATVYGHRRKMRVAKRKLRRALMIGLCRDAARISSIINSFRPARYRRA